LRSLFLSFAAFAGFARHSCPFLRLCASALNSGRPRKFELTTRREWDFIPGAMTLNRNAKTH
jgi:hypothetical protein